MVPEIRKCIALTPAENTFLTVTLPLLTRLRLKQTVATGWDNGGRAEAEFMAEVDSEWDVLSSLLEKLRLATAVTKRDAVLFRPQYELPPMENQQ